MRTSPRLAYVGAFDGLRGVAVAAVLAFHAELGWARGGFLGVSAFFTLSGYLITTLLLRERAETGRIDLRAFWARRARRLLPASFLAIVLVLAYATFAADGGQLRTLRGDVLAALGDVANWRFLAAGRSYEALFSSPSPVQHFWSLAIEEQCYFAVPLVVAGLLAWRRGRHGALAVGLVALTVASVATTVVLSSPATDTARVYYGTDTRAAELLVGALLALALHGRTVPRRGRAHLGVATTGAGALVVLLWWWATVDQPTRWLYDGGLFAHASLTAAVLVAATVPGPVARILSVAPLRALGRVSYGVYLFHWPIYLWLDEARTGLPTAPLVALRVAVTLALAAASFRLLERPILTGVRLAAPRPRVALPAAAATVAVALLAVTLDPPGPEIVFQAVSATAPTTDATTGTTSAPAEPDEPRAPLPRRGRGVVARPDLHRPLETARPLRVLVVGDSVGVTLGRGLERWGASTGDAAVWNLARYYCAIGRYADRTVGFGVQRQDACDDWGERWPGAVDEFDPDTVVVLSTFWELISRRAEGWADWAAPGDPTYDEWQLGEYVAAVDALSARGARVVWLTIPCSSTDSDASSATLHRYNVEQLARLRRARSDVVRIVDLFGEVCPHGTFTRSYGGLADARPDGAHFSDPGADAVAAWLGPLLLGEATPSAAVP